MDKILTYGILAILAIITITVVMYVKKRKAHLKLVKKINDRWGKNPFLYKEGKISNNVPGYYQNLSSNKNKLFSIDDITWNDLDMDSIFQRLNNTHSTVGEQYLYYILRKPLMENSELKERNRIIEFFRNNKDDRLKVQLLLAKLGKVKSVDITNYLINDYKGSNHKGFYYKLLALGFLLSPFSMILNLQLGLFLTIGFFITNMTIQYKNRYEIESHLEAFNYIVSLIICAEKISNLKIVDIDTYRQKLKDSLRNLKGIVSRSFLVLYRSQDPFLEYIKVMLLGELIAYESMFKLILKHRNDLIEIFNIIGLADSLISIASYRESIQYFTTPKLYKLIESKNKLCFTDIYHPLINDPVANTLDIDKPILITGSNASGKSTFLKTIAINAIFAQTIYTCLAKNYSSCYFMIFTSMALKDSLIDGESYYIVEIKSLRRIIDSLNPSTPCLCIIDEVLRGTNTVERIAASSQVLYFLSQNNCLPIAATHDLELAHILKNHYANYHFQEYVTDNDIVFDYKIYPGKSSTRNAIKLLKIMGYKDTIVESSEAGAQTFMEQGKWQEV